MEKRVVLFLILALLIVFGWNFLLEKMGLVPPPPEPDQLTEPATPARPAEVESRVIESRERTEIDVGESEPLVVEEVVKVETDLFRAQFSSRGAVITSWELKEFTSKTADGPVPVQLMYSGGQFEGPLSVRVADEPLTRKLEEGLYRVERDFFRLDSTNPVGNLTFTYRDPETGVLVEKELRFHYDKYLVDVRVRTRGISDELGVGLGTNFGIVEWGEGFIGLVGPAFLVNEEVEKETPDNELIREGEVRWVALQDKYFMSVIIPQVGNAAVVRNEGDKLASAGVRFGGSGTAAFQLYAGPKEYDTLKDFNVRLEETIDFGWFIYGSWTVVRALAKPLFFLLRFFDGFTHNYGLAIILLTVCVRLFFVPLQYKSYKSMKDMQGLQPKMVEIQTKYKDDKQQLNQEIFKLYREHKVNPLGGCLPMVLQMPVFIALFNILYMTIDLRQAPFMLWIDDMSIPDPFYVLPIMMGLSMVIQQKIMPTTMDPTQAKMMLLLPVFLTFIFLNFASGLVLYWLTNNVLAVTQQFVTDRFIFKKPTFSSLVSPAAEGGGAPPRGDGQQGGGQKKKNKKARKKGTDHPVES